MREKGKSKKVKKILIRVSKDEKLLAEELSKRDGKNTSEFFRDLLRERNEKRFLDSHNEIIRKYEETLKKYQDLLERQKPQ